MVASITADMQFSTCSPLVGETDAEAGRNQASTDTRMSFPSLIQSDPFTEDERVDENEYTYQGKGPLPHITSHHSNRFTKEELILYIVSEIL
jgi:hypothetical protein